MLLITSGGSVAHGQQNPAFLPRLIAIGSSRFNGTQFTLSDSSRIFYSGTRGGDLNNQLKYDSGAIYAFNAPAAAYNNTARLYQAFDGNDNLLSRTTRVAAGGGFANATRFLNTYTADGQVRTIVNQQWSSGAWSNVDSTVHSYNAAGYRIQTDVYQWQGTAWRGFSRELKHYTLGAYLDTNRVQYAANGVWRDSLQDVYLYDADTFLLQRVRKIARNAVFVDTLRALYANNAQGDPVLETNQQWTGSWTNTGQRAASYTASGKVAGSLLKSWNGSLGKWDTVSNATFTYDPAGNLDAEVDQVWNSAALALINYKRFRYAYNATAQVVSILRDTWSPSGQAWAYTTADQISRYHYEDVLGVGSETAGGVAEAVLIAPNPAVGRFAVTARLRGSGMLRVLDATGRLRHSQPLPAGTAKVVVETERLEPGVYIVQVSGAESCGTARVLVVQ